MAVLFINKPPGPTSHDIVDEVRRIIGDRRVGHAGTLDPFAEGLLIVLTGPDTKRQGEFMGLDKTYEATFILGEERDTDDVTGRIRPTEMTGEKTKISNKAPAPNVEKIKEVLKSFEGEMEQMPPPYSAKKIKGKKAYELARRGETPQLKAKKVTIYNIELLDYEWPELKIRTKVSSGTYIRALARDIGRALKIGAYVGELKRTRIGDYLLKDARDIKNIKN